jgi:hypothetical protein
MSRIYTAHPEADHDQAKIDTSCSCSLTLSGTVVSSATSGDSSLDSCTGLIGPWGTPKRVENICRWHSSQKQKYEKWPSSKSLCTVAPGTIRRTNSATDGDTTLSSIPCGNTKVQEMHSKIKVHRI